MELTLARIERALRRVTDLPTLPNVARTLSQMVNTPHISAAEIGKLISEDQSLAARVLHVVNSAYYGFPQQINNVTHAIVILGFNKVRDVVMTASVIDALRGKAKEFDFRGFWMHSIASAIACEALARTLRSPAAEDSFVAGLLHDIGKLVLAAYYPPVFQRVSALATRRNILFREAECEILEFDHAAVGRILAERWSFPPNLVEAIQTHHAPGSAKRRRDLACLVHTADILARAVLVGSGGDRRIPTIDAAARRELGLTRAVLDRALAELFLGLRKARAFFDLLMT